MLKPTINFTVVTVFVWTAIVAVFMACMNRSEPGDLTLALMIGCEFISAGVLIWYTFVAIHSRGTALFSFGYVVTYFLMIAIRYGNTFDIPEEMFRNVMYHVLPHNFGNQLSDMYAAEMRAASATEFCRILCSMLGGLVSLFVAKRYALGHANINIRTTEEAVRD